MNATLNRPRSFEFGFLHLDAQVLVEDYADTVDIRSSRNTLSASRKAAFVRELAAEGFIDDHFRWFAQVEDASYRGVRWRTDFSWLELPAPILARARRFMIRLLPGGFLLWATLLAVFVLRAGR